LGAAVAGSAGFALGPAVEVVNLIDGKGQPIDLDSVAVLVLVVAHAPDNVHVRALAQVLGRVLGLLAPQRPLDRGGFFFALLAAAASAVADGGQHRFGELALAPVDEFELDGTGQVRVALHDLNVGHDETPCVSDQPDPDAGSKNPILSLGLPRSRPRAGGGWARPLPWGRGGGWGDKRSRSSEPVTWPTAERSPHKSPSPGTGAPWGDCGGLYGARAARASLGATATRRRPVALSSGGSAGGVTPS
jgi:hypothetical protein